MYFARCDPKTQAKNSKREIVTFFNGDMGDFAATNFTKTLLFSSLLKNITEAKASLLASQKTCSDQVSLFP